jgi:phospholipid transport system substrate-binding protein
MPSLIRRDLVLLLALGLMALLGPLAPSDARADPAGAVQFVRAAGERTVTAANADAPLEARVTQLATIMQDVTDIDLIARLALGKHWRAASEAQRPAYLAAFRSYALDSLAYRFGRLGRIDGFAIVDNRGVDERDTLVATDIRLQGQPVPTRVDWRVRLTGSDYQIIDVVVEGVSLLITNRNDFDAVVNREGLDRLIARLQVRSAG